MSGRVIQGFFIGGRMCPPAGAARPATVQRVAAPRTAGAPCPPAPAFAIRPSPVQARLAPGRPSLVHQRAAQIAQPHRGSESFEIDPAQIGLARGGGSPLPRALLAKMEAAFATDFSGVRVHVGPQAARIGAVAFTTGSDLYFAPGRYQPESVQGQQLIGHELAHVVQQRQGRVRAPTSGVAVVQDRTLEAEADRLGTRAAAFRAPGAVAAVQRQRNIGTRATVVARPPAPHLPFGWRAPIQRSSASDEGKSGSGASAATHAVTWLKKNDPGKQSSNFSVALTDKGHLIVSKVGGLGSKAGIIAEFSKEMASEFPSVSIYLAPVFNSAYSSGNHAEMCVAAGANSETGNVLSIVCTHPNCDLCAAQMVAMGITGSSITSGTPDSQSTWAHPTQSAAFGTAFGSNSMSDIVAALNAFNAGKAFSSSCGSKGSTPPKAGGAKQLQ